MTDIDIMVSIRISMVAILISVTSLGWADNHYDAADLSQAQFHFKHQRFSVGSQVDSQGASQDGGEQSWQGADRQNTFFGKGSNLSGNYDQYDATFSYPFTPRDRINFDLGINIRFIDADLVQGETEPTSHNLNAALPMFYANAMFGLPYEGLSASFGASHVEYEQYYAFDYKAKLSYQWQNGFGMEGGWQHQELSIDGSEFQTDIQNKSLFLDFKYHF